MKFEAIGILYAIVLTIGMLILLEVGRRFGLRKLKTDPDALDKGVGTMEGAVFGLLGLIIAFTFSGAASRFESRWHLVTDETNDIGTAYLRIDLLTPGDREQMKNLFRTYVDQRINTYKNAENVKVWKPFFEASMKTQGDIWKLAVRTCEAPGSNRDACKLLLPALNEMIDITTTRIMATRLHPPKIIYFLMGILCLLASLMSGYGTALNKSRSMLHKIIFAAVMSFTIYVIIDLEYPRLGLIRVDAADSILIDLRNSMK